MTHRGVDFRILGKDWGVGDVWGSWCGELGHGRGISCGRTPGV